MAAEQIHAGTRCRRMKRDLNRTEARQGVVVPAMKYVLGFGTAGAAIGLLAAWVLLGG